MVRAKKPRPRTRPAGARSAATRDAAALRALRRAQVSLRSQVEALREATQAVEQSRDRYLELFDSAPVIYVAAAPDGTVVDVNQTGVRMLQRARDQIVGTPIVALVVDDDRHRMRDELARWRSDEEVRNFDVRLRSPGRGEIPVQVVARRGPSCVLLAASDATDRLRMEAEFERIAAERRRIEHREALALAVSEAKDRFLAMLSHELRTPLAPILTAVSGLSAIPDLPSTASYLLDVIRRNVLAESRLIEDLLDLSRIRNGQLQLQVAWVDVHEVMREVVEQSAVAYGTAPTLRLETNARRHHVEGDRLRLYQVLWNLVVNARRNTPDGGTVVLESRDGANDLIHVSVRDQGAGIDPALLSGLFTPFLRVESDRDSDPRLSTRLGLGLAICKAIVEAHGGAIAAESPGAGRGATFEIRLRSHAQEIAAPAPSATAPREGAEPAAETSSLRILLVDDHEDSVDALAFVLRSLRHRVTVARTFAEAVARRDDRFDVLVTDIELPDGSGLDLVGRIGGSHPPPAIALSGHGGGDLRNRCERAGFREHLVKPVDVPTLLAAVFRAMRPAPPIDAPGEMRSEPQGR